MKADVTTTDYGDVVIIWDHNKRETFFACPHCGSRRVHISSYGDGIICGRTRDCGFSPWGKVKRVIPPAPRPANR